jgi:hypothetical protein
VGARLCCMAAISLPHNAGFALNFRGDAIWRRFQNLLKFNHFNVKRASFAEFYLGRRLLRFPMRRSRRRSRLSRCRSIAAKTKRAANWAWIAVPDGRPPAVGQAHSLG